ncbi:HPr family phosphocarrier protein [Fodinicurvata fenggangensis]|uniref:HPr family phosphocarrier protein n=1 Tax=Fodinicurvata fenggangensis TaxID=1121830 RepID=UPI00068AC3F9|nr:HPr family phosphocarrier protein [Fodinicurvata fenggangensis]
MDSGDISSEETAVRQVTICNRKGLHARAAAKFVKLVATYQSEVLVIRRDQQVTGSSIMGLMMLAAGPGCEIELQAQGPDATEVLDALEELIRRKFDED